jgi:hypothetical protein
MISKIMFAKIGEDETLDPSKEFMFLETIHILIIESSYPPKI